MQPKLNLANMRDPNVDLILRGTRIASVLVLSGEFIVDLAGGAGSYRPESSGELIPITASMPLQLVFAYGTNHAGEGWAEVVAFTAKTLEQWYNNQTNLTIVGVPGKNTLIFEPAGRGVVIPRPNV